MNWPEFLKPTTNKIIITLIMVVIIEGVVYIAGATSIFCEPCPPPPVECPPCVAPEIGIAWALAALIPVSGLIYLVMCLLAWVLRHKSKRLA